MKKFTFLAKRNADVKINLDEQITRYLHAKKIEKRSDKTLKTYGQTLNQFKKWYEDKAYESITSDVMKEFIHYLSYEKERWDDHPTSPTAGIGLSARGVNNVIRNLKVFFNFLVSERILSHSPMDSLKYQTEEDDTFEVFSDEDVMRLLDAPNRRIYTGLRDRCMMLVLADTGLRVGELTNLKISDIDFKLRQIVIRAEITKTNQTRVTPISSITAKELEKLINFMNVDQDDYLWLTQFGERYFADTFAKMLKKYGQKAGITGVRVSPHTFRHYFAVSFLRSHGDQIALMRILGHTDLAMTSRYVKYTQTDLSKQHDVASPVTNLIDKSNEKKRGKVMFK